MKYLEKPENPFVNYQLPLALNTFKTRREEIVDKYVKSINVLRGGKFKPITHKEVAIRLNSNRFLVDDGEAELLFKKCESKQSFAFFFYCAPLWKKTKERPKPL